MRNRKNRRLFMRITAMVLSVGLVFGLFDSIPFVRKNTLLEVEAATISSSVIESAIAWGQSQSGSTAYNDKCQAFVWQCFNQGGFPNNSAISFASAKLCGDALITNTDLNAPRGACVFFDCSSHGYGHIGISLGNGQMIHAGHKGVEVISFTDANYLKNWYWLTYRGWGIWGTQKGNTIGTPSAPTISVGTSDVTDITETNAVVRGTVNKDSSIRSGMKCGVRIGTSASNFNVVSGYLEDVSTAGYDANNGTSFPIWFNVNSELGATLSKGTRYYYQMMVTYGGKTYYGEVKSFVTAGDGTKPVISNVKVTDYSKNGYTVTCTVTDNVGVSRVQFPTWTAKNDQDDLAANWATNPSVSGTKNGNTYSYRVNTSDHNNESGNYATHIYAYDAAGNTASYTSISVNIDGTAPTIINMESYNKTKDGFSVKCKAKDNVGVSKIIFEYGIGDSITSLTKKSKEVTSITNGEATATFSNIGMFSTYTVRAYAYDVAGNVSSYEEIKVYLDIISPVISNVQVTNKDESGYTVSCTVTDNVGVTRVQFPAWTTNAGQDDIFANWSTNAKASGTKNGNTYTYRVKTSEHNNELGEYQTVIYAYDAAGNYQQVTVPNVILEKSQTPQTPSNPSEGNGGTGSQTPQTPSNPSEGNEGTGSQDPQTPSNPSDESGEQETENQPEKQLTNADKKKIKAIKNKKAVIKSVKNVKGRKVTVKLKKVSGASGYEIRYSTSKKFKNNVKKIKTKSLNASLKKLTKGKKYYIKARPYYKDSTGQYTYGKYSSVKKVTVRK